MGLQLPQAHGQGGHVLLRLFLGAFHALALPVQFPLKRGKQGVRLGTGPEAISQIHGGPGQHEECSKPDSEEHLPADLKPTNAPETFSDEYDIHGPYSKPGKLYRRRYVRLSVSDITRLSGPTNHPPTTVVKSPEPLHKFLAASSGNNLSDLIRHARSMEQLSALARRHLGAPLGDHCRAANLREGILLLHADSSAWANRLRYELPALLEFLRQQGQPELRSIRVKVPPPDWAPPAPRTQTRPRLSAAASELLRHVASTTQDPDIRGALLRLAKHVSTSDK